ncbi:hypothetical protein PsYK624_017810 [Phanerochaete sordida]|uniref:Retroviral polymerase SH3-like domain-containing protein n=1 Tax=Phanerochaete sordida TaxID=48140 RepID=A0A9P3FYQ9_9APHY|nr:hypothetical protein PsYK624_017810 [Phanerochaete sordida]
MEKCIFIGYPPGYKGWKFYNPSTKKEIISERAIVDEWYLPGLKNWLNSVSSAAYWVPLHAISTPASLELHSVSPPRDAPQPRLGGRALLNLSPSLLRLHLLKTSLQHLSRPASCRQPAPEPPRRLQHARLRYPPLHQLEAAASQLQLVAGSLNAFALAL